MKFYSELKRAIIQKVNGILSGSVLGELYFRTDTTENSLHIKTNTADREIPTEYTLPRMRRTTKVQLDDAMTGNEVQGVLPYTKGGTGISSLIGNANKALVVSPTEDGFEFADSLGGGGGGGAVGLKARGVAYTDGSSAEFNVQTPFLNTNGKTQITTNFEVINNELVRFFLDGKKIPLYISDLATPSPYYKKIDNYNFELDADYSAQTKLIEIEVYSSAELPEVVPSILAGLAVKNEGFYVTSVDGTLIGGNTVIDLGFEVSQNDVGLVFVDGQFACPDISLGYTHSWRLVESDKIELLGDLAGSPLHVYVVFFEGSSSIDAFGNIELVLRPKLANIILEDSSLQKWSVKVSGSGELETVQVASGVVDPIRLKRLDTTVVELTITTDGELVVNDTPLTAGILFEDVYLASDTGMAWKLFVGNDNILYIVDSQGNKWGLKDQLGDTYYQIKQTECGTLFHTKYCHDASDIPTPPEEINDNVPYIWVIEDNLPVMKIWDTIEQEWVAVLTERSKSDNFPVGTVLHSFLTLVEFRQEMGDTNNKWVLLDGGDLPECDFKDIRGWTSLPNGRGSFLRGENTGGTGALTLDPDYLGRIKKDGDNTMLGSFQLDAFQGHIHPMRGRTIGGGGGTCFEDFAESAPYYTGSPTSDGTNGTPRTGKETRPVNIAVNYFVKIKR